MNRKLMLVGALALAGMLAVSSAVSAAVDDPIILDDGGGHPVVMLVNDSADFANVVPQAVEREFVVRDFAVLEDPAIAIEAKPIYESADLTAVMLDLAAEEVGAGNCSDYPAWVLVEGTGSLTLERLGSCSSTGHPFDPGWRAG